MKSTLLGHACLFIESGDTKIVLDPYLTHSCWAGQLFVVEVVDNWKELVKGATHIVFSHAHQDHYNEEMLMNYWDLFKDKIVVIPNFRAKMFFIKRLSSLGFENIIIADDLNHISIGEINIEVSINNRDMDSSWFFYTRDKNKGILAQTDNIDIESLFSYKNRVSCLWYLYTQTGIFPNFLEVDFETKLKLLEIKKDSWFEKIRELIHAIKPQQSMGYASDMFYGLRSEANFLELALEYPVDLHKALPGAWFDMKNSEAFSPEMPIGGRLERLYKGIISNKSYVNKIHTDISLVENKLDFKANEKLLQVFVSDLTKAFKGNRSSYQLTLGLINSAGDEIVKKVIDLGSCENCDNSLRLSIKIPIYYLYMLINKKFEMGAISVWNGAIDFYREDINSFTTEERGFWRTFRRLPYYD